MSYSSTSYAYVIHTCSLRGACHAYCIYIHTCIYFMNMSIVYPVHNERISDVSVSLFQASPSRPVPSRWRREARRTASNTASTYADPTELQYLVRIWKINPCDTWQQLSSHRPTDWARLASETNLYDLGIIKYKQQRRQTNNHLFISIETNLAFLFLLKRSLPIPWGR